MRCGSGASTEGSEEATTRTRRSGAGQEKEHFGKVSPSVRGTADKHGGNLPQGSAGKTRDKTAAYVGRSAKTVALSTVLSRHKYLIRTRLTHIVQSITLITHWRTAMSQFRSDIELVFPVLGEDRGWGQRFLVRVHKPMELCGLSSCRYRPAQRTDMRSSVQRGHFIGHSKPPLQALTCTVNS